MSGIGNSEDLSKPWADELYLGHGPAGAAYRGVWKPGVAYATGDLARFGNAIWRATAPSQAPVPSVVAPSTFQHLDGTMPLPVGTQEGDLVFLSIIRADPAMVDNSSIDIVFPDPIFDTLIQFGNSVPFDTTFIKLGVAYLIADVGLIASGISIPPQFGGRDFVTFLTVFRDAKIDTTNLTGFLVFGDLEYGFSYTVIGSSLRGSGTVTTADNTQPQYVVHDLVSYIQDTNYCAAAGYGAPISNLDAINGPASVDINGPVFFVSDTDPTGDNRLQATIPVLTSGVRPGDSLSTWLPFANIIPPGRNNAYLNAIVLGQDAEASATSGNAVIIGVNASSQGNGGISIGDHARIDIGMSYGGIAIGHNALADSDGGVGSLYPSAAIAIGEGAYTAGRAPTALGYLADAEAPFATALGANTFAFGPSSVAIGYHAEADSTSGIAIGPRAWSEDDYGIAIGDHAQATGLQSNAFGTNAYAAGAGSVAIGTGSGPLAAGATALDDSDIAIGGGASASGGSAVAIGSSSQVTGVDSVAIGTSALASSASAVAIGGDGALATGASSVVLGSGTASGFGSVVIGDNGSASGQDAVGISNNTSTGRRSFAFGPVSDATADDAIAFGSGSLAAGVSSWASNGGQATGDRSIAMGYEDSLSGVGGAHATQKFAIALGGGTRANGIGSVAIGTDSSSSGAHAVGDNDFVLGTANHKVSVPGLFGVHGHAPVAQSVHGTTVADAIACLVAHGLMAP